MPPFEQKGEQQGQHLFWQETIALVNRWKTTLSAGDLWDPEHCEPDQERHQTRRD